MSVAAHHRLKDWRGRREHTFVAGNLCPVEDQLEVGVLHIVVETLAEVDVWHNCRHFAKDLQVSARHLHIGGQNIVAQKSFPTPTLNVKDLFASGVSSAMKSQLTNIILISLILRYSPTFSVFTVGISTNGQRDVPQHEGVRSIALSRLAGLHHIMEVLDHKLCCCSCVHTSYLSRTPRTCPCKFFLAGVNFYRFNAKNWKFTVYFAVITQKLAIYCVFCRNLRVFSV